MSSVEHKMRLDAIGASRVTPPSPTTTPIDEHLYNSANSPELGGSSRSGSAAESTDLPNMERPGNSVSPLLSCDLLDGTHGSETDCPYCHRQYRQPRVLNCLHCLCEDCVIALLEGRREEYATAASEFDCELEPSATPELKPPPGVVRCPVCKEDSQIGNDASFVRQMLVDYVTVNIQDSQAMEKDGVHCESCKAKDQAEARCQDCSSFLCKNCVQAHQYMRCFEGHTVVTMEEMKEKSQCEGIMLHRPVLCPEHPNEPFRYFCISDSSPVCNECLLNHKSPEHRTVPMDNPDCHACLKKELNDLVELGRSKEKQCEEASVNFSTHMSTLNDSRKAAQEQLDSAFDKFKEMLENRKHQLMVELDEVCLEQEQRLNGGSKTMGALSEKISDACRFGERLSVYGTAIEMFLSRKTVMQQLTSLVRKAQCPDVAVSLTFSHSQDQFEQALQTFCGTFKTDEPLTPVSMQSNRDCSLFQKIPNEDLSKLVRDPPPMNGMPPPYTANYAPTPTPQQQFGNQRFYPPPNYNAGRLDSTPMPSYQPPQPKVNQDAYTANLMAMINLTGGATDSAPIGGGMGMLNSNSLMNSSSGTNVSGINSCGYPPGARPVSRTDTRSGSAASSHSPPSLANYPPNSLATSLASSLAPGAASHNPQLGNFGLLPHTIPGPQQYSLFQPPPCGRTSTTPMEPTSGGWGAPPMGMPPYGQPAGNGLGPQHPMGNSTLGQGPLITTDGVKGVAAGLESSASVIPPPRPNKMPTMEIKCKFGSLGQGQSMFNSPHGFCLGFDDEIVVADTNNHRIQVFSKDGDFIRQFGLAGKEDGHMWYPRKVTVLNQGMQRYVVCDRGTDRSRMQLFSRNGDFIKTVAIRYIDIVAGLCVDKEGFIVAVDSVTPTVFRISETGELNRWFDCSDHMKEPSDIAVANGNYYVCDFKGHCVCVFGPQGDFLSKIGCEQVTSFPNGIDISDMGDVLIGDSHGNRFHVAIFKSDGSFQTEFECPFVKVSRCCGLRITSEGLIVTLAKNNHHLLVLNTLYVN